VFSAFFGGQLKAVSAVKPITIIGGGLAGLTLGIGLRQRKVPVTIWEAGQYPRHRVCGEFISGRGQEVLVRLGLKDTLTQAGATEAGTAAFFLGEGRSPARPLRPPALCLSRFRMDACLAARFRECGGELQENQRWRDGASGEGLVRANGRQLQPVDGGWRWLGLKVHARNIALIADLEMHGLDDGYVGLCRLQGGEVNVCGLFRSRKVASGKSQVASQLRRQPSRCNVKASGSSLSETNADSGHGTGAGHREVFALLLGPQGTLLHERLAGATFDEDTFCAVAGFSIRPRRASAQSECCIGDALTMIPPVTGNGMSMAFESAELAVEPLAAYSGGEISWPEARGALAGACDRVFARRLAWARWLQRLMFAPALRGRLGKVMLRSGLVWRMMFARTR
jgi:hypothetical protein